MKQLLTASQTIECYLSEANFGQEYLRKHFPYRYSRADMEFGENAKGTFIIRFNFIKDEQGVDICDALRGCADKMNHRLEKHPDYLHSATAIDNYGRLLMVFEKSNLTKKDMRCYMEMMEVE